MSDLVIDLECNPHERELILRNQASVDLDALQEIIPSHFHEPCCEESDLREGAFARVFKYTLESGKHIVARVILTTREHVKTKYEVATMCFIIRVYLYCSSPDNPVNTEWILMEFLTGDNLRDEIEDFGHKLCLRFANDLAEITHTLFQLASNYCGSLICDLSVTEDHRALAYTTTTSGGTPSFSTVTGQTDGRQILLGPLKEISLITDSDLIPAEDCGPFETKAEFLSCCTWKGNTRAPRAISLYNKMLEIFVAIKIISRTQPLIKPSSGCGPTVEVRKFHFAHGDLTYENILVDLNTGAIVGTLDWEASGFYPTWLACRNTTYLNDDSRRCLMTEYQEHSSEDNDGEFVTIEREYYLSRLSELSPEMYYHDRADAEVRAFFYHLSHSFHGPSLFWLNAYRNVLWNESKRGPFPIDDMVKWTEVLGIGVCG